MLAERRYVETNRVNNIIQFPSPKKEQQTRQSTKMWCLKDKYEIKKLYNVFYNKVRESKTKSKYVVSLRNLTMYVCAINIGLRGGDFCNLKWSDIYDDNWNFKQNAEYVPQKTKKCHKHINLSWSDDFEIVLEKWKQVIQPQKLDGYIFISQKGSCITEKSWYKIVETSRKEAGIVQKIGTHGLRKTMANQYIKCAEDKSQALLEVSNMFGHSDLRITERYACLEDENIKRTKQRMSFLT